MKTPWFGRLVKLYENRLNDLLQGDLFAFLERPDLVDTPEFRRAARLCAQAMARWVSVENAKSWREAASKSTRSREIYQALRKEIYQTGIVQELESITARNAELISSVPGDIAQRITEYASERHIAGARAGDIEDEIRKMAPKLAENRIRLIARTEISRAETDLTRARAERIGAEWYQWATSEDQRVRTSHINMDKVLVCWSDPPNPEALAKEKSNAGHYHAGGTYNCRCLCLPLIDLDEVSWPCRVYSAGSITRMTRAKFSRLSGYQIAA